MNLSSLVQSINAIDVLVVLLVIAAAISGFRQGLITALFTLVCAVAGAVGAVRLAPLAMDLVTDSTAKIAIGIACVVVGVGIGEVIGSLLGRAISSRIRWRPARAVDRTLGIFGYSLAVLLVIWLVAVPLASVPWPWLSSTIRSSTVLGEVDKVMPDRARDLSTGLRQVFNDSGFPAILDPLAPTPGATEVAAPDAAATDNAAIAAAAPSILKVRAVSESCSRRMEGTGFVIGPNKIMTNAHVVAGSARAGVEVDGGVLTGSVVVYDPDLDIAVLDVPDLSPDIPALRFASSPAPAGADAVVAGYPLDGPYTLSPARIRAVIDLRGPNIYSSDTVVRQVYTIRAQVRPGNSGGPLLGSDGTVLGVIFGGAIDSEDVGFALTADQVAGVLQEGLQDVTPTPTQLCTAA